MKTPVIIQWSTWGAEQKYRGVEQLEARRAHNPEVVGSSPASATKELLKSQDFRSSSFLSGSKSWEFFQDNPPDPYRDPYADRKQKQISVLPK